MHRAIAIDERFRNSYTWHLIDTAKVRKVRKIYEAKEALASFTS
jgi:predicted GTPase